MKVFEQLDYNENVIWSLLLAERLSESGRGGVSCGITFEAVVSAPVSPIWGNSHVLMICSADGLKHPEAGYSSWESTDAGRSRSDELLYE